MNGILSIALLTALFSGCLHVQAPASDTTPSDAAGALARDLPTMSEAPSAADGNANLAYALQENVTRNESVVFRAVASGGSFSVSLRLNGTMLASEILDGERQWTLPLPFGRTELVFAYENSARRGTESFSLVRLGLTKFSVDYCHFHPASPAQRRTESHDLWVDVGARPTDYLYRQAGGTHIDAFTAHDQLWVFRNATKRPVDITYYPQYQGFFLDRIDGAPTNSGGGLLFWNMVVNGKGAETGMSLTRIQPGDAVHWELPCA